MIGSVEARTLARSILEARREGRKLKPLTNTRLLSQSDSLKIQDALIELRLASGEEILGWALIDGEQVAPVMTSNLVDDRVVMGIPSQAVDVRIEPVVVADTHIRIALRAMDRLMPGALIEDAIAAAHGLVTLARGDVLAGQNFDIRTSRTRHTVTTNFLDLRDEVNRLLGLRGRSLQSGEFAVSAALIPGDPLMRGEEALLQAFSDGVEARCFLRHL